jgi:hypothetical protein
MTNQLEIEIGDTVRIVATSRHYSSARKSNPKCDGIVREICGYLDVDWGNNTSNTYQRHDLILIKKGKTMKEFTKSDLKTGMFVKFRRGDYRVVLGDYALDIVSRCCLLNIKDNLLAAHDAFDGIDIMAVYRIGIPASLSDHLKGNDLLLIWERTEQTPAQKEMEVLQAKMNESQAKMNESQAKMNELQAQMKVVQAKL